MKSNSEATQPVQLTALTSIRFFAALHILLFHVYEGHRLSNGQGPGWSPIFDELPAALLNGIRHGYLSTSLFFLISGFILSYLYILPDGTMSVETRAFWIARARRVYPLHILILGLAAPFAVIAAIMTVEVSLFMVLTSGFLNAALLQAWYPPYALTWNFPTWALSAVVFFYLTFPALTRLLRGQSRRRLACTLAVMPIVSLLPTLVLLAIYPDGGEPQSFWREFVMRNPLFWIPHFFMGMLLSRLFGISRFDFQWQRESRFVLAWGDLAFAAILAISMVDIPIQSLLLRHGLLAPLFLVMIYHLAGNRGLLARLLSPSRVKSLGDASFSIFMLQMPVFILIAGLAYVLPMPSALKVCLIVLATVGIALLSTNYFEKPFSRRLRKRFAA